MSIKIGVVAGEPSGDTLGEGLLAALRERYPQARFEGIGGAKMQAQGCQSLFPLEALSVMGLVEVLRHLPTLLKIRRALYHHFRAEPPAVFIGIDAPDFNLPLEARLRTLGIRTVHYVSPQVWAWRQWRVREIGRAVDLMLTLLPFEAAFYQRHQIPVRHVGHPLADAIPFDNDRAAARQALGLRPSGYWVALLPGSRLSEVSALGPLFVATAIRLQRQRPDLGFVIPAATPALRHYLDTLIQPHISTLKVTLVDGRAREVMTAADTVLLASGTATLEAMLLKRPMVVAYKVAPVTAWIARRLIQVPHYALPNLLAETALVPEFMQQDATADNLGRAVLAWLDDPAACERLVETFTALHQRLQLQASAQAAAAVAELLDCPRAFALPLSRSGAGEL